MWQSGTLVLSYQGKVSEFAPDAPGTHISMVLPPRRPAFGPPATATGFACPAGKTFVHGFTCGYAPG